MKLDGEYVFEASVQEVWDALFDPAVLAAVMPGCEKLELVDGSYLGDIKVKVGPIQGKFSGKVDLLDLDEPKSYKMNVDGKGAQGFVKATAAIRLEPNGTGTKVFYDADAQVGGKIASVGQRLVETSAKAIVKQSLEGLSENIKIRSAAYRAAAKPAEPVITPVEPAPVPQVAEPVVAAVADAVKSFTEVVMPAELAKPAAQVVVAPAPAAPVIAIAPSPVVPAIEYKKADASKLAGAVAKEVTKTLAPIIAIVVVAIILVVFLIVR